MPFVKAVKKIIGWSCFVFTVIALVIMFTPVANRLAAPLLVADGPDRKTDVIAVLGGGAYSNGVLGGASNERLIKSVLLYRQGRAPKIVFTGGKVVGVNAKLGHTVFGTTRDDESRFVEARLMRDIAVGMGVPPNDCVVEENSLSTYENLRNLKALMEKEGMKTTIIVSSPLHMRRAVMAAARLGVDFTPASAPDATMQKTTPIARVHLMRDVLWEYFALGLYWTRGQI